MRSYLIAGLVLVFTLLWPPAEARTDWCSGHNWLGQRLERQDQIAEGLQELRTEVSATEKAAAEAGREAKEDLQDLASRLEKAALTLDQETAVLCRRAKENEFKEADFKGVSLTGKAEIRAQLRLNLVAIGRYQDAAGLLKSQAEDDLVLADKMTECLAELSVLIKHLTLLKEKEPQELDQELMMTIQSACQVVKRAGDLRSEFEPLDQEELLSQALTQAQTELDKPEFEPDLDAYLAGCSLMEKPAAEEKPEKPKKPWYKFW